MGQVAFMDARAMIFLKNWVGRATIFGHVQKISKNFEGLPQPVSTSPYKFVGCTLMSDVQALESVP